MAVGVNRDASLFCRAPGSDLVARHGGVAPSDHAGSAGRRTEARGAGRVERSPRHNKSGHGRSSCRSAPAPGSPRKETAALMLRRHDRNAIARWTNATIARILSLHACPARCGARRRAEPPSSDRRRACPSKAANYTRHRGRQSARCRPAEQQLQLSIGSPIEIPLPARANAGKTDPAGIRRRIDADSGRHRQLPMKRRLLRHPTTGAVMPRMTAIVRSSNWPWRSIMPV